MVRFSEVQSAKVSDAKVPIRHDDGLGVGLETPSHFHSRFFEIIFV